MYYKGIMSCCRLWLVAPVTYVKIESYMRMDIYARVVGRVAASAAASPRLPLSN